MSQFWTDRNLKILHQSLEGLSEDEISKNLEIPVEELRLVISDKKFLDKIESEQNKIFLKIRQDIILRVKNFLDFLDKEINRLYNDGERDALLITMIREYGRILTAIINPPGERKVISKKSVNFNKIDIEDAKKALGYEEPIIAIDNYEGREDSTMDN